MVLNPRETVRAGYDRVSFAYRSDDGASKTEYTAWLDLLCADLPPNPSVLDLGCGCGVPVARELSFKGRVTGVDFSDVQIDRAMRLVPGAEFVRADMSEVSFPSASFDAVVAFYSLIHLPADEQPMLIQRIASWLKLGGRFIATVGSTSWTGMETDWLGVDGATMYWSQESAETYGRWLLDAGFRILHQEFVPEEESGHELFYAERIA